jgi:hypothetical protein
MINMNRNKRLAIQCLIEASAILQSSDESAEELSDMVGNNQDFGLLNDDIEDTELDEEEY